MADRDAENLYAESLRKMLVAMAEDIRVVLIKLADRLHNMRTLDALPDDKRRRIAQETLDVYSPLAHRLGIWEIKWQLDDLAFRHLNETRYRENIPIAGRPPFPARSIRGRRRRPAAGRTGRKPAPRRGQRAAQRHLLHPQED